MHKAVILLFLAVASSQVCNDECSKVLGTVNQERAKVGKPPLCINSQLMSAAQNQAAYQSRIKTMTHTGSGGSSIGDRVTATGYKWTAVAENVAYGQSTARDVMLGWMNSPGHKKNILSDNTQMGLSHVGEYWAQTFGTPRTGAGGCDTATLGGQHGTVEAIKPDIGPRCTGMCQTLLGVINSNRQTAKLPLVCISPKLMTAAAKVASTKNTQDFRDAVEDTGFGAQAVGLATQTIRSSAGPPTDSDLSSMFRQNYRGSASDNLYTRAGIASDTRRENWYIVFAGTYVPNEDQCEGFAPATPQFTPAPAIAPPSFSNPRVPPPSTPITPPAATQCSQFTTACQCLGSCGWSSSIQKCVSNTIAATDCNECPRQASC